MRHQLANVASHSQTGGPAHHHRAQSDHSGVRAMTLALAVTLGYALVEAAAGWLFGSLALMSDAGHMFTDSVALALAAFAAWLSRRPAGSRHSYGFARAEVIAALVNGLALLLIVILIAVEAVGRLLNPQPVAGLGVMGVAFVGLLINLAVAYLLGHGDDDMNRKAALLHVVGDKRISRSKLPPVPSFISGLPDRCITFGSDRLSSWRHTASSHACTC
jgi:cobalt-zinc-cadmium efflux system protein